MRLVMIAALGIFLVFTVSGCSGTAPVVKDSGAPVPADAPVIQRVSIDSGDVYEDCFELKAGQSMDYEFTADGEMRYNLHWHNDADMVEYAVKKIGVTSDKGTFVSEKDEYYCLMWRNNGDMPVSLAFSCKIR